MITQAEETIANPPEEASIGFFERWLTVWVFLCIGAGIREGYCKKSILKVNSTELGPTSVGLERKRS